MFRNYFKIAFRNLWRHRVFSGINLLGLAVGMSSFLLIFSYVSFERSYDAWNLKADRIYRINCDTRTETEVIHTGTTAGAKPGRRSTLGWRIPWGSRCSSTANTTSGSPA